jgi:hypothetical protein
MYEISAQVEVLFNRNIPNFLYHHILSTLPVQNKYTGKITLLSGTNLTGLFTNNPSLRVTTMGTGVGICSSNLWVVL